LAQSVTVSSVTAAGFAVSFTTSTAAIATLSFGTSPGTLGGTTYDDRDGGGPAATRSTIHRFTLAGLTGGTTYYFEPVVNGSAQAALSCAPYQWAFHDLSGMPPFSKPVAGSVTLAGGAPPAARTVLITGYWTNSDGTQSAPVSVLSTAMSSGGLDYLFTDDAMTLAGDAYFPVTPGASVFHVEAAGDDAGLLELGGPVSVEVATPNTIVPPIVLSASSLATPSATTTSTYTVTPTATATSSSTASATQTGTSTLTPRPTATTAATASSTRTALATRTLTSTHFPSVTRTTTPTSTKAPGQLQAKVTPTGTAQPNPKSSASPVLPACRYSLALATPVVMRGGREALFIVAQPASKVSVDFQGTYPLTATLFSTQQRGSTLAGRKLHAALDYQLQLPADGLALLVFDIPARAPLGPERIAGATCVPIGAPGNRITLTVQPPSKHGQGGLGTATRNGLTELRFQLPSSSHVLNSSLPRSGSPVRLVTTGGKRYAVWTIRMPTAAHR
jgi:hypothetical protein